MSFLLFFVLPVATAFAINEIFFEDDDSNDGGDATNNSTNASSNGTTSLANFVNGTEGADNLTGTDQRDVIDGKGGNDTLFGGNSLDIVEGGAGNDKVFLGSGNDIYGGYTDAAIQDILTNGTLSNPTDNSILDFQGDAGDDFVRGENGNDIIVDVLGSNTIYGDLGADRIVTYDLDNSPTSNTTPTADTVFGGFGADQLYIDNGDTATGGAQADLFSVLRTGSDNSQMAKITDFNVAEDTLELIWPDSTLPSGATLAYVDTAQGVVVTYNSLNMALLEGLTTSQLPNGFTVNVKTLS